MRPSQSQPSAVNEAPPSQGPQFVDSAPGGSISLPAYTASAPAQGDSVLRPLQERKRALSLDRSALKEDEQARATDSSVEPADV